MIHHSFCRNISMRCLAVVMVTVCSLAVSSSALNRADRLSPLAKGYVERARIMLADRNYAGVIDQLYHLDTQGVSLSQTEREDCAYLLALSLYQRGDAGCVSLLREFAVKWPASPQALPARLAAADYFFFAHHFDNALAAYDEIDFSRINPADRSLYEYRRGLSLIRTGHYEEARPVFEQLRDNRKFNVAADYYLAYLMYVSGNYDSAYKAFEEVVPKIGKDDDNELEPLYYIAQIDYTRSQYEKVTRNGLKLISDCRNPELLPETERIVGLSFFKLGDYEKSRKYLSEYVRHAGSEPASDAIYALGVADYMDGDIEGASRRFASLTSLNNEIAQSAYLYLGQIAVSQGDNNAAAVSFEKASRMTYDPQVTEAAMFNYIAARTHGGNIPFSSSIPLLSQFLEKFPRSRYASQVREYLATAYFNEKDYARALESVNRIPDPSNAVIDAKQKILYELGMEAMSNNRPEQAAQYLSEGVTIGSDRKLRAQSYLWLGDAYYSLGKYSAAEKSYNSALSGNQLGENATLARYNLAYARMMQEKWKSASQDFSTALKASVALPQRMREDAVVRLADVQYYMGDYRSALKTYTTVIDNHYADADYATYRRAIMYGLAGDIKSKISELSALPSRFPGSRWLPNALLEKGQTYTGLGDTRQAVEAFEELRNSHKQTAQARKGVLSLALAYMKEGDLEKGEKTYREVISKWPTSEEASLANDDLRTYYAKHGGLQEYAAFLKGVKGAPQIDESEIEKLAFEGGETAFADNITEISLLEKYVAAYPDGRYLAQALLDIAQGRDELKREDEALDALNVLLDRRSDSPQVPEALLLKAQILEEKGPSFAHEALDTYRKLEQKGGNDYTGDAYAGIMRTADNDAERMKYAALVRKIGGLSADQIEEAEFYEASSGLKGDSRENALKTLENLASNPKSLYGARAAVLLGENLLENGDVNGAEKVLTAFTDEGSPHEYWLARGFIALSDVYHTRGKDYLAVEYLKSLRDNYPGKELDIHDMIASRLKKWDKK